MQRKIEVIVVVVGLVILIGFFALVIFDLIAGIG